MAANLNGFPLNAIPLPTYLPQVDPVDTYLLITSPGLIFILFLGAFRSRATREIYSLNKTAVLELLNSKLVALVKIFWLPYLDDHLAKGQLERSYNFWLTLVVLFSDQRVHLVHNYLIAMQQQFSRKMDHSFSHPVHSIHPSGDKWVHLFSFSLSLPIYAPFHLHTNRCRWWWTKKKKRQKTTSYVRIFVMRSHGRRREGKFHSSSQTADNINSHSLLSAGWWMADGQAEG